MAQSAKQSVNSKDTLFAGAMPKGIGAPEFLKVHVSGFSMVWFHLLAHSFACHADGSTGL